MVFSNLIVKIPVFGVNAEVMTSFTDPSYSATPGAFFSDADWLRSTNSARINGVVQGIARSVDYNTVLRQVSMMCSVLANILAFRNGAGVGSKTGVVWYGNSVETPIGTDLLTGEDMEDHIGALSDIFGTNLLFDSEVITRMINDLAVTTPKIADYNVTLDKLASGSVSRAKLSETLLGTSAIGVASVGSTANGITVSLSQSTGQGATRGITISVDCSFVTNAINASNLAVYQSPSPDKIYLAGPTVAPTSTLVNRPFQANSSVYIEGTAINASSFNVPSDETLKDGIEPIGKNQVRALVDKVDIKTFHYKSDPSKTFIGVIAQDIQKANTVIGDLLIAVGEDGTLSVQESKLPYILWDYVKQLGARVSALEKRLGDK